MTPEATWALRADDPARLDETDSPRWCKHFNVRLVECLRTRPVPAGQTATCDHHELGIDELRSVVTQKKRLLLSGANKR